MDVISDHSQAKGEQSPEPEFDHRIRWGNVALALAALVAIVAAVGLPGSGDGRSIEQSIAPMTDLVTESVPTPPTAVAPEPRPARAKKRRTKRKRTRRKPAKRAPAKRTVQVTPAPTPTQAPAPPAPDQTPAAEREFGL